MGISFTHDRLEELQEQARLLAVTNARKHEMLVKAAGGSLGTLDSINEGGAYVPHLHRFEHADGRRKDSLPIAGGQQDFTPASPSPTRSTMVSSRNDHFNRTAGWKSEITSSTLFLQPSSRFGYLHNDGILPEVCRLVT